MKSVFRGRRRRDPGAAGLGLLKKPVEGAAGVVGVARRRRTSIIHVRWRRRVGRAFARHGDPRRKEGTLVSLVFVGDAYRNGLQALKTNGGLEVRALFAAVQLGVALGTSAGEVDSRRECGGAVVTAGRGHVLHQTR